MKQTEKKKKILLIEGLRRLVEEGTWEKDFIIGGRRW